MLLSGRSHNFHVTLLSSPKNVSQTPELPLVVLSEPLSDQPAMWHSIVDSGRPGLLLLSLMCDLEKDTSLIQVVVLEKDRGRWVWQLLKHRCRELHLTTTFKIFSPKSIFTTDKSSILILWILTNDSVRKSCGFTFKKWTLHIIQHIITKLFLFEGAKVYI